MDRAPLQCSFCGKSQHEVRKLIAGPTVFICDECVALCAAICMADEKPGIGPYYVSTKPPLDTVELIKQTVREMKEQDA